VKGERGTEKHNPATLLKSWRIPGASWLLPGFGQDLLFFLIFRSVNEMFVHSMELITTGRLLILVDGLVFWKVKENEI